MEFEGGRSRAENEHPRGLGATLEVDFIQTSGIVDEDVGSSNSCSLESSMVDDRKTPQNGQEQRVRCIAGNFVGVTVNNDGNNDERRSQDGVRVQNDDDEVSGSGKQDDDGGCRDLLPEDEVKKPSLEVKEREHGFQENKDPLFEVMFELETVQEALGKELLLLREISKDAEEPISDLHFKISQHSSPSGFQHSPESTDVQKSSKGIGVESDEQLTKKIETEVVNSVIAATVQSLNFTTYGEEKAQLPSHFEELTDKEDKYPKEAAVILGNSEVNAATVCKHASYVIIQLLLLLLAVLISQTLSNNRSIVPT